MQPTDSDDDDDDDDGMMKFHFTQAVCGIREQYSLERAQGMGGESQKLTCASTALDSKSEKSSRRACAGTALNSKSEKLSGRSSISLSLGS